MNPYARHNPHPSPYPPPGMSKVGTRKLPKTHFHIGVEVPSKSSINVEARVMAAIRPQLDDADRLVRRYLRQASDERRSRGERGVEFHSAALRDAGADIGRMWRNMTDIVKNIRTGFVRGMSLDPGATTLDDLPAPLPAKYHAGQ